MISNQTPAASRTVPPKPAGGSQFRGKSMQQLSAVWRLHSSGSDAAGPAMAASRPGNAVKLDHLVAAAAAQEMIGRPQILDGCFGKISTFFDLSMQELNILATPPASRVFARVSDPRVEYRGHWLCQYAQRNRGRSGIILEFAPKRATCLL